MPAPARPQDDGEAQETDALLGPESTSPRKRRASSIARIAREVEKRNRRTSILILLLAVVIIGCGLGLGIFFSERWANSKRPTGLPDWAKLRGPQPGLRNPSYYVRGRHGAVAAENGVCSSIGIDVLRENGTATDAAIAAALCIGVVNPFSSGIGGGGFLVTRPACPPSSTKRTCPAALSIDFRETAPTGSFPAMFGDDPLASLFGGLAVGVPGELRGFEAAYKAHGGGVPWARLFEPSIALAEKHHVGPELARRLQMFASIMSTEPQWAKVFSPKGAVLLEGDVIRRPELAHTLRTLARHGADAFYRGPIAEALAKVTQAHGGGMTAEDLAAYRAIVKPALVGTYRNRTIYTTHAPSSGAILISLLNTLEPLHDYVEEGRTPLNMHRFIEAQKYAFAHRTEFGDPAFVDNADKWREVVRKDFGRDTLALINDTRTYGFEHYRPHFDIHEDHGTTHLSVVDAHGGACSLTSTVNIPFGAQVMCPETGIILNDEMADFSKPDKPDPFGLRPSPYNYPIGPPRPGTMGKRPLSSTSASIIESDDGRFILAIGGSGGSRIFGAVVQTLLLLDWGYDLQHAVEEPRVHNQLLPAYVSVESGMPIDITQGLRARGHNVTVFDVNTAVAEIQAAMLRHDDAGGSWIYGASDSRKNGRAAAY